MYRLLVALCCLATVQSLEINIEDSSETNVTETTVPEVKDDIESKLSKPEDDKRNNLDNDVTEKEQTDVTDDGKTVWHSKPALGATYQKLYEEGIDHYLAERYHECASFMESAIADYRWYKDGTASCRMKCRKENYDPITPTLDPSQLYYENIIMNTLCLLRCRQQKFGDSKKYFTAPSAIDRDFEIRKPYDYLQLCYFKIGRYQDAANAAVTVLSVQPEHKVMADNLKQYIDTYSVDVDELTNLELQPYAQHYVKGDHLHHQDQDYEGSVREMEAALLSYWEARDKCRALCEEPFDMGWFPDFVTSVANHFTFTLRCKRNCAGKLAILFGDEVKDFLPSILNYLQYGYYQLKNVSGACGAVESYLELLPADASMLRNKQLYLSEFPKSDSFFKPRKDIVTYINKERNEDALLQYIDEQFVFFEEANDKKRAEENAAKKYVDELLRSNRSEL